MIVMMLAATTAYADDDTVVLDLAKGTYQIGGQATANIALVGGNTDVYLLLSPSGGIFVADNAEVYVAVDLLVDENAVEAGVSGGLDYFFPGEWVAPYLGIGVGYGTRQLDDAPNPFETFDDVSIFTGSVRAGLLLPVSPSVGIDLGVEGNFNIALDPAAVTTSQTWITIPMGYTGVRAFFR